MTIATWILERLKSPKKLNAISEVICEINADILILTEDDSKVQLDYPFMNSTPSLAELDPEYYKQTERRVSIHSMYEIVKQHETYDPFTACCVEIATPVGNLIVYGTILGIYGNRCANFKEDVPKQIEDYKGLAAIGSLCVAGDFNMTFSDNYYFTTSGRNLLTDCFEILEMEVSTAGMQETIDHIAISKAFIRNTENSTFSWNNIKLLSDHKGVGVRY